MTINDSFSLKQSLLRFYTIVCRVELMVAMITLILSTLLIFVSAVMRSLAVPLNWSLEISLFLFAWSVFLSADVGLRRDCMVRLDMLVVRLPKRLQHAMSILSYSIIFAFLCTMIWFGFRLAYTTRFRAFLGIPSLSYTWITISLPIASILMLVTTALKLRGFYRLMTNSNEPPPEAEGESPAFDVIPPV